MRFMAYRNNCYLMVCGSWHTGITAVWWYAVLGIPKVVVKIILLFAVEQYAVHGIPDNCRTSASTILVVCNVP